MNKLELAQKRSNSAAAGRSALPLSTIISQDHPGRPAPAGVACCGDGVPESHSQPTWTWRPRRQQSLFSILRIAPGVLLFVLTAVCSASAVAADQPLVFGGDKYFPPFESLEKGKPTGYNVDLIRALSKAMGRDIEMRLMQFGEAQRQVLNGELDALTMLANTKEREGLFDFSEVTFRMDFVIFIHSDRSDIRGVPDLQGKTVAVKRGGAAGEALESNPNIRIVYVKTDLEGLNLLADKQIDAFCGSRWVGAYAIQSNGISGITIADAIVASTDAAIAVKKGNTELLNQINSALDKLKNEGTLSTLESTWAPTRILFLTYKRAYEAAAVIGIGLTVAIFWTATLMRANAKLRRAENELSKAQSVGHIGSWYWDADSDRTTGTDELLRIYGFDPATQTIPNFKDQRGLWYPVEEWERLNAAVQESVRTGVGCNLDLQALRNSSPIWINAQCEAIRNRVGQIVGLRGLVQDISGRKHTEEVLRQRAEEVERLLETVPAAVWVSHDPQCMTITGNRRANEFYEAQTGENVSATGRPEPRRFVASDGREILPEELPMQKAAAINQDVLDTEVYVQLPSGRRIAMLGSAVPLRNEEGSVRGCIGAFMDITDRKETEKALRESEEQFRVLTQNLVSAVALINERGEICIANPSFLRLFNFSADDPILNANSRDWSQWQVFDEAGRLLEFDEHPVRKAALTLTPVRDILVAMQPPGCAERRWMLVSAEPLLDAHGNLHRLICTYHDITERKRAEEALHLQSTVLVAINRILEMGLGPQTEEEMCRASLGVVEEVTNSSISFIGEVGSDGLLHNLAISNPGWDACRIYGQTGHRKSSGNFATHGIFGRVMLDGKSLIANDPSSHPDSIGLPQDHPPLTAFLGVPLMREGKIVGMIAVGNRTGGYQTEEQEALESIAPAIVQALDRKRAEEALHRLNESLEIKVSERTADLHAANQALEQRAAQLRELAGELAMTEQRERKAIAKLLHDGLQQYLVAARMRQSALINELGEQAAKSARDVEGLLVESINVSRSLAIELCPPALDGGIMAGLEWLTRFMASKHGVDVKLQIDTGAPVLPENVKVFVFESVRELLLNVVKHSRTLSATVHLREDRQQLKVTVSDGGVGFDVAAIQRRESGGAFGLFSIRERIGLVGGSIELDSTPGKGARFTITVPLAAHEARPLVPPICAYADTQGTGSDGKMRILLADDHKVMRESLALMLGTEEDLEIVGQAEDGNAAVELTQMLRPHLILMDLNMPNMDGITATRIITERHPEVQVIGLSFYRADERAEEMIKAGAKVYLSKTAPAEDLKRAIRSCAGKNLRQEKAA